MSDNVMPAVSIEYLPNPLGTNEVYAKAHEKYLKTRIIYANPDTFYVFRDEAHTQKIPAEELLELCLKGVHVFDNISGTFAAPNLFGYSGDGVVVIAVGDNTWYSAEHMPK